MPEENRVEFLTLATNELVQILGEVKLKEELVCQDILARAINLVKSSPEKKTFFQKADRKFQLAKEVRKEAQCIAFRGHQQFQEIVNRFISKSLRKVFWQQLLEIPDDVFTVSIIKGICASIIQELGEYDTAQQFLLRLYREYKSVNLKKTDLIEYGLKFAESKLVKKYSRRDLDDMERKDAIQILFGLENNLNDTVQMLKVRYKLNIQEYFQQCKAYFLESQQLYSRYKCELYHFLVDMVGIDSSPLLSSILSLHGRFFFFLDDEDLVQLTIDVIYGKQGDEGLSNEHFEQVLEYFEKFQELNSSDNQSKFVNIYLGRHLQVFKLLQDGYRGKVTFRQLLLIQHQHDQASLAKILKVFLQNRFSDLIKDQFQKIQKTITTRGKESTNKWSKIVQNMEIICEMLEFTDSEWLYDMVCDELLKNGNVSALQQIAENKDSRYMHNLEKGIVSFVHSYYDDKTLLKSQREILNIREDLDSYISLLLKVSPQSPDHLKEQRLMEVCDYFTGNHMLLQCPLKLIRMDFFEKKLLKRILQVHGGVKEYPLQYQALAYFQKMVGEPEELVFVEVIQYLDAIRALDTQKTSFLKQMVIDHFLQKSSPLHLPVLPQLFQLSQQEKYSNDFKVRLSQKLFTLQLESAHPINLQPLLANLETSQFFHRKDLAKVLKQSLKDGTDNKSKLIFSKMNENGQEQKEFFDELISKEEFTYKQQGQLAQLLGLEAAYESKLVQFVDIRSAVFCKDYRDGKDMLMEHYGRDGPFDLQQLWLDLCKFKLRYLTQEFNQALLEIVEQKWKLKNQSLFKDMASLCPEINLLPLIEYHLGTEKFNLGPANMYEKTELIIISEVLDQKLFRVATELQLKLSDQNLFSLIWILDQLNPKFTQISGICFYASKLLSTVKLFHSDKSHSPEQIEARVYGLVKKDVIADFVEEEEVLQAVNEKFKRLLVGNDKGEALLQRAKSVFERIAVKNL